MTKAELDKQYFEVITAAGYDPKNHYYEKKVGGIYIHCVSVFLVGGIQLWCKNGCYDTGMLHECTPEQLKVLIEIFNNNYK